MVFATGLHPLFFDALRSLPQGLHIDLVYLPIGERDIALREISDALVSISRNVESRIPRTKIVPKKIKGSVVSQFKIKFDLFRMLYRKSILRVINI